jgi:hypothetical protein
VIAIADDPDIDGLTVKKNQKEKRDRKSHRHWKLFVLPKYRHDSEEEEEKRKRSTVGNC